MNNAIYRRLAALLPLIAATALQAQSPAFTYQGRLATNGTAVSGSFDLTFTLFSVSNGAGQVGSPLTNPAVAVSSGLFTTTLDFGANFPGADRWLEIGARTNGGSGAFTTMSPRQKITPAPYAITASNLSGTLPASQLSGTLPSAALGGVYSGAVTLNNAGNSFTGNGGGLTNLNATNLFGTMADARLSANVALRNTTNTFTGSNIFSGVLVATNAINQISGVFSGNGANVTNVSANNLAGGTVPLARLSGITSNQLDATTWQLATNLNGGNAAALNGLNSSNFWQLGGNNVSAGQYIGSTNNQPMEFKVSNTRALRIEPTGSTPNMIGGSPVNFMSLGIQGGTIGGGGDVGNANSVRMDFGTVGGGAQNTSSADSATVGGGYQNTASGIYATVGGGHGNTADGYQATVGGGVVNAASGYNSTVGGGSGNQANTYNSVVAGGAGNVAGDSSFPAYENRGSTVGGGVENTALAPYATVAGGYANTASGAGATVSGGGVYFSSSNTFSSYVNWATGTGAVVPGGAGNFAEGTFSFAAGNSAKAHHDGAFVWADYSSGANFNSTSNNQFLIRASGGVGIGTANTVAALTVASANGAQGFSLVGRRSGNYSGQLAYIENTNTNGDSGPALRLLGTGNAVDGVLNVGLTGTGKIMAFGGASGEVANVTSNGTFNALAFNPTSDRNAKENFTAVSAKEVLSKVVALPITRWNFKQEPATPYLGPMAQDFHAAFGVGPDEKHIATVDADGVALAAIQGLNQKLTEELKRRDAENAELKQRLEKLEQLMNQNNRGAK